jgi:hypothetical protein
MMRVIQDPYFRKAVEFAELAEQAMDAQKRANYTVLADCYRRLSRRANAIASANTNIAAKPEPRRADQ